MSKQEKINHSNQMNPNNCAYWEARGWDRRPDDWEERVGNGETMRTGINHQITKGSNQQSFYPFIFEKWSGKTTTNSRYSYLDDDDE